MCICQITYVHIGCFKAQGLCSSFKTSKVPLTCQCTLHHHRYIMREFIELCRFGFQAGINSLNHRLDPCESLRDADSCHLPWMMGNWRALSGKKARSTSAHLLFNLTPPSPSLLEMCSCSTVKPISDCGLMAYKRGAAMFTSPSQSVIVKEEDVAQCLIFKDIIWSRRSQIQ